MRKLFLIVLSITTTVVVNSQTLFKYGNKTVTQDEFLNNFNKNANNLKGDRNAALKENLELYIKYKLKVQAAYDFKYDTLANQKDDLQSFKKQIEGKYLTEDKTMKLLIDEAHTRMQKDIRVSHILILVPKNAQPADTVAAIKKINEAYEKLKTGKDFEAVANEYSQDPAVKENNGDLGYITAFSLPYTMENAAYKTPIGKFSAPFKSKIGYHIFKNVAERKTLGRMRAAQVLIPFIPNSSEAQKMEAEKRANEVYDKLQKGENFENLARAYSGDMMSAQAGGLMQEFGVGKYEAIFENTFAQLKEGTYSKPFKTSFGWHILKRVGNTVVNAVKDDEVTNQITALINNDSRKEKAKEVFINNVIKITNYKEAAINKEKLFYITTQKLNGDEVIDKSITESTLLHSYPKLKVTVGNFWQFTKDAKVTGQYKGLAPQALLQEYVKATAFEYYKDHLEEYNADYRNQINEFKDGNLLFEAMERNVWNKSAQDSVGLAKYYAANKTKYIWDKSADVVIFSAVDKKTADSLRTLIVKNPKQWSDVITGFQNNANAEPGRYELGNIPVADKTAFANGLTTEPYSPNNDGNMVFSHIFKLYDAGAQRSFEDARGLVINDYQVKLEEDWIAALRKKYPVKVDDKVWQKLLAK
jgi:peptidyl-prolyl cis-trans isomerase SurA